MLHSNNLNATACNMPRQIGGCGRLGVLSLRDNTIWKLPDDIGLLKELHVLDVSGNRWIACCFFKNPFCKFISPS